MSFSAETYAVAKKYTDDSMQGAGAVAGKPCQIQSITDITGGKRVTFLWVDNSGTSHTSTMDVMNGVNGQDGQDGADGKGIKSVDINASNHLIVTFDDDTTHDAGEIQGGTGEVISVNGKKGVVTLDASDVGALADDTPLFSGDYDDLSNKPSIPSNTSDLTNDSNFVADASYVHTDNNYDATAKGIVDGVTSALADKMSYADNGVLGAKNWFGSVINGYRLVGDESTGYSIGTVTNGYIAIGKVPKNTNFIVSKKNGAGNRFSIALFKNYPTTTPETGSTQIVSDTSLYTYSFNTGNYEYVVLEANRTDDYSNIEGMLRLATDPDNTYVPYAMTNRELTEKTVPVDAVTDGDMRPVTSNAVARQLAKVSPTVGVKQIKASSSSETYETYCGKVEAILDTMPEKSMLFVIAYPPQMWGKGEFMCTLFKNNNLWAELKTISSYEGVSGVWGFRMVKINGTWETLKQISLNYIS